MSLSLIEIEKGVHVSVNDIGNPTGSVIIINHGMIASIKDVYLFDSLIKAGKRIISIARPGYGSSSVFELQNIAEWGSVVRKITMIMGIDQFDVLGISSGAPYSYGIAHEMENEVKTVFIFSGTPALFNADIVKLWPFPIDTKAQLSDLQILARNIFFPNGANESDNASIDSYRNDCFGIALDLKIRCIDWGFDIAKIRTEIVMEHSVNDNNVPFITAELTSRLFSNCTLRKRQDGEHFSKELLENFINNIIGFINNK